MSIEKTLLPEQRPPVITGEMRAIMADRHWITPGVAVIQKISDRPIMTVLMLQSRRIKELEGNPCPHCAKGFEGRHPILPKGLICENGDLVRFRNFVDHVLCKWIDVNLVPHHEKFQIKELLPWVPSQ